MRTSYWFLPASPRLSWSDGALALQASAFIGIGGLRRGVGVMLPIAPAVLAFGAAFGASAIASGLHPLAALTMSALVFAGAAQFAAIELWPGLPILSILLVTLAVNARHIVLGATLAPWLQPLGGKGKTLAAFLLSDANWASTRSAIASGEEDRGHLIGGGILLWLSWVVGTAAGLMLGSAADTGALGVDLLLPAFFVCALISSARELRSIAPWLCAGVVAAAGSFFVDHHWATLAGTAAGAATAVLYERD